MLDGLYDLIDAVESKIAELGGETAVTSSSKVKASRGKPMKHIFEKIMSDTDVEMGKPDKNGDQIVFYKGKDIGWYNPSKYVGYIDEEEYAINSSRRIKASEEIHTKADLESAICDELDSDICSEIMAIAVSEDGTFENDIFMETEEFFNTFLSPLNPKDVVMLFIEGKDLDDRGPANPRKEYLRFSDKRQKSVESTDYPGDIYFENYYDDIVGYIMDHLDDREFPDAIQELIDEYKAEEE